MRGKIGKLFDAWFKRAGDEDYEDWPQWHGFHAGYCAGLRAAKTKRKKRGADMSKLTKRRACNEAEK